MAILSMRRALAGALGPLITILSFGRVAVDTSGEAGGEDVAQEKRGVAMRPVEEFEPDPDAPRVHEDVPEAGSAGSRSPTGTDGDAGAGPSPVS